MQWLDSIQNLDPWCAARRAGVRGGPVVRSATDYKYWSHDLHVTHISSSLSWHCSSDELPITHKTLICRDQRKQWIMVSVTQPRQQSHLRQKQRYIAVVCLCLGLVQKLANTHLHMAGEHKMFDFWSFSNPIPEENPNPTKNPNRDT